MININKLTKGENKIMLLVSEGYSNKGIADMLYLSEQTINNYLQSIYDKLQIVTGESYNRRVRAVYLFNQEQRKETAEKIKYKLNDIEEITNLLIEFLKEEKGIRCLIRSKKYTHNT